MQDSQAIWRVFDETAPDWGRSQPVILTDFTARPLLLEWCEPLAGARVLELGCGEGFTARQIASRGAARVVAIDPSRPMIARARAAERDAPWGIDYQVGDATALEGHDSASFDLVVADFLFDCLSVADMELVVDQARRLLRPGGRFVMVATHPALPFLRSADPPLFVEAGDATYSGSRDHVLQGRVWRRDGIALPIVYRHKTVEDYVRAFHRAGWHSMPEIRELGVRPEHIAFDPGFFEPLHDLPLHLAARLM